MQDQEADLKSLMLAALDGDAGSYRVLLTALAKRLRPYFARRLGADAAEADDLTQEVLIAIHAKRATYDAAQPLTAWVFAIARYKLIDHQRRRRRRTFTPLDDAGELFEAGGQAESDVRRDLDAALATLPPRSADLLRDVKVEGLTSAEAAARHGMSETAVKVGVHRSLRRLAARFGGEGER